MTRNQEINELIEELWASDEASALTNRASRMIETLYRELIATQKILDGYGYVGCKVQKND
jgi:hypothetical protein